MTDDSQTQPLDLPAAHPGGSDLIQVALVGCGSRGGGAVLNAVATKGGPVKLVAMADAYEDRLEATYKNLAEHAPDAIDAPRERRFTGFDAYRHAMDCLRPGDV